MYDMTNRKTTRKRKQGTARVFLSPSSRQRFHKALFLYSFNYVVLNHHDTVQKTTTTTTTTSIHTSEEKIKLHKHQPKLKRHLCLRCQLSLSVLMSMILGGINIVTGAHSGGNVDLQMGPERRGVDRRDHLIISIERSDQRSPGGVDSCFSTPSPLTLDAAASKSRRSASSLKELSLYSFCSHSLNYRKIT